MDANLAADVERGGRDPRTPGQASSDDKRR